MKAILQTSDMNGHQADYPRCDVIQSNIKFRGQRIKLENIQAIHQGEIRTILLLRDGTEFYSQEKVKGSIEIRVESLDETQKIDAKIIKHLELIVDK